MHVPEICCAVRLCRYCDVINLCSRFGAFNTVFRRKKSGSCKTKPNIGILFFGNGRRCYSMKSDAVLGWTLGKHRPVSTVRNREVKAGSAEPRYIS